MKKIFISLLVILALTFTGCGASGSNKNAIADKPFEELENEYKNETAQNMLTSVDDSNFYDILNQLADTTEKYANYLTTLETDVESGKKLCEIDNYKDSVKEIYEWYFKILYFNSSKVNEKFTEAWKGLQRFSAYNISMLDKAYTQDPDEMMETLNQMFNQDMIELQTISDDLPLQEINKGETITVDGFVEMTFNDTYYTTKVEPEVKNSFYSYYEVDNPNNVFLAIKYDITNLYTDSSIALGEFATFNVTYEGGYQYPGFAITTEYDRLTGTCYPLPLNNYGCWFLIEVPASLQDVPFELTCTINNQTYLCK